ncbi:Atypical kinase COQ8, mitochondrial [Hanseniaspora osmophila]|uniref:Atypical kinase COQ8, mitochondrial n=1 Tax=Hanseniaspora osmophila TaxID=56408 RepID=A0A1E5RF94_9ASCO|nr:Atypical kinase COQ8, mitochondrial [Hanseniaspora osmophila]
MASRQGLYDLYCVLSSSKEVLGNTFNLGKQSLQSWSHTSMIARPILSRYQWFYDPKWEEAKKLAQEVKEDGNLKTKGHTTSKKKHAKRDLSTGTTTSKRHFSTISMRLNEGKKDPESVQKEQAARVLEMIDVYISNVGFSAARQGLNKMSKGEKPTMKSLLLSNENIDRIVKKFSKMRGAALKIGQMLSFQDEKVLPKELYEILSRVQNNANYMPLKQLDKLMQKEFHTAEWDTKKFSKFDKIPIAAASIGQVHEATLKDNTEVVVKIQYPGVKDSIDSDLNNLLLLLTASSLLPKGLFLDKTVANARTELKWECDYIREANCLKKFEKLLQKDPVFAVPHVYDDYTTSNVLTMTKMKGVEIMKLEHASQEMRDFICTNIMRLCLQEIAEYQYMQTDPNWANFLYNKDTQKIELIDFGATRPYPPQFIKNYRRLLTYAAVKHNRKECAAVSKDLGYLTGLESSKMVDAHVDSVLVLGEPFSQPGLFDFGNQTVTDRIRGNIGVMLNERLVPPPEETYSLHRKFSGVFLLCARMKARVPCHDLFKKHFAIDL